MTMKAGEQVSMRDIARLANTSTSTVSRVMNGGYVAEEMRNKILGIMEEVHYSPKFLPNRLPRICVLLRSGFTTPYAGRVLPELSKLLSLDRLQMLVVSESDGDESWTLQSIRDLRPDILICLGRLTREHLSLEAELKGIIQLSDWDEAATSRKIAYFAEDMEAYGRLSVAHLESCGHRNILLIHRGFSGAGSRNLFKGVTGEGGARKVNVEHVIIPPDPEIEEDWLLRRIPAMLDAELKQVTACILSRSSFTYPLYLGVRRAGVKIPGDLSIIARKNPIQKIFLDPEPTSFVHDPGELDRHTRNAVLAFLRGNGAGVSSRRIKPRIIPGGSVAPPANSHTETEKTNNQ